MIWYDWSMIFHDKMCENRIHIGATDIAPHVSQYELLLSGRWGDPRSVGSYVETSEDRRYAISKSMNMNFQWCLFVSSCSAPAICRKSLFGYRCSLDVSWQRPFSSDGRRRIAAVIGRWFTSDGSRLDCWVSVGCYFEYLDLRWSPTLYFRVSIWLFGCESSCGYVNLVKTKDGLNRWFKEFEMKMMMI